MVFKQVQELVFKTFGAHAGRMQLDYLTVDLRMDPSHSMKQFFRLLTAHSEAQPYYPPVAMDTEVADPFHDDRKIQIKCRIRALQGRADHTRSVSQR